MANRAGITLCDSNEQVILFGTGKIGVGIGYDHIKTMGLSVDFYCDNDPDKWGKRIKDEIYCISPNELHKHRNAVFYILTKPEYAKAIETQLLEMGIHKIVKFQDIEYCDEYVNRILDLANTFYGAEKNERKAPCFKSAPICNVNHKQIALYTCITGGYEPLTDPNIIEMDLMDYYFISEKPSSAKSVYQYLDLKEIVPDSVTDPVRQNRFCKILGCEIFSEYPYSIYIDGKVLVNGKLSKYLANLNITGITLRREEEPFDCIYKEAAWAAVEFNHKELIVKQMHKYYQEGMPRHWGAFDCTCLIRDNQNARLRKAMSDWWNEVYNYSYRDQNSFTYALWKNGYSYEDIIAMPGTMNDDMELPLIRVHR